MTYPVLIKNRLRMKSALALTNPLALPNLEFQVTQDSRSVAGQGPRRLVSISEEFQLKPRHLSALFF